VPALVVGRPRIVSPTIPEKQASAGLNPEHAKRTLTLPSPRGRGEHASGFVVSLAERLQPGVFSNALRRLYDDVTQAVHGSGLARVDHGSRVHLLNDGRAS